MTAQLARSAADVGFITRNRERLLTFYREVMGFPPGGDVTIPGVGTISKVQCGESVLKLLQPENVDRVAAVDRPVGAMFACDGLRYMAININNINALCERLQESGAAFVVPLREIRPGVHAAVVQDPDGNYIELMQENG